MNYKSKDRTGCDRKASPQGALNPLAYSHVKYEYLHFNVRKQEVLGRTSSLLSFHYNLSI
jgi:hypothetical protein